MRKCLIGLALAGLACLSAGAFAASSPVVGVHAVALAVAAPEARDSAQPGTGPPYGQRLGVDQPAVVSAVTPVAFDTGDPRAGSASGGAFAATDRSAQPRPAIGLASIRASPEGQPGIS